MIAPPVAEHQRPPAGRAVDERAGVGGLHGEVHRCPGAAGAARVPAPVVGDHHEGVGKDLRNAVVAGVSPPAPLIINSAGPAPRTS
ncbi:hypothetical protein AB0I51_26310 [Streptomyces sp. NPDC050549]|uniref:hypothetical protein n=1 Tax=Streptomyces sp. NPDC050549 TaxID=3155406 RepID=UPI003431F086